MSLVGHDRIDIGDLSGFTATGNGASIVTAPAGETGRALRGTIPGETTRFDIAGAAEVWARTRVRFNITANPSALTRIRLLIFQTAGIGPYANIGLLVDTDGSASLQLVRRDAELIGSAHPVSPNTWYDIELYAKAGATTGAAAMLVDGVEIASATDIQTWADDIGRVQPVAGFNSQAVNGLAGEVWHKHVAWSTSGWVGEAVRVLTRQFLASGTPTYDQWTKTASAHIGAVWSDTPVSDATNAVSAASANQRQTAQNTGFAGDLGSGTTVHGVSTTFIGRSTATNANVNHLGRFGGSDQAVAIETALTTANSTRWSGLFGTTPTFANLDVGEVGVGTNGSNSLAVTASDVWLHAVVTPSETATEIEPLAPNAVLAATNLQDTNLTTPPTRLADIQDDPQDPDANWWTAVDPEAETSATWAFPNPSAALVGTQTVELYLRKTAGTPDPTVDVYLDEDGVEVEQLLSGVSVTSTTGQLFTPTFAANLITDRSKVQIRFVGTPPEVMLPRAFEVDPAVSGKTTWDLDVDGVFTVNGPGTWTITPLEAFAGDVALWGGGGGSGGHGATTATAGGNGGNTTFSGQTANGGNGSLGRTNNTAGTGATGGTASGGDTNTTGATGGNGAVGNTSTGGSGGSSPNGGGTASGTTGTNGVSSSGNAGNAPGGGASGGARGSIGSNTGERRAVGGAGGAGYSFKQYALESLTAGTPITLTVGGPGTAGTGDQAAGSAGAAGRATIT
jgi:hypothetical protein